MEIINATDIDNWSKEVKCSDCNSKLKIKEDDLQFSIDQYADRCGGWSYTDQYHVICPICQNNIFVSTVLPIIKQRVKQKHPPKKNWIFKLIDYLT